MNARRLFRVFGVVALLAIIVAACGPTPTVANQPEPKQVEVTRIVEVQVPGETKVVEVYKEPGGKKVDQTPRLAVMSAFGDELKLLLNKTQVEETYVINGRRFTTGALEGNMVVLFLSGVSMTNAAMTTQTALDYFTITHIVFSGIAGGVNPELNIGDVVVPAKWAEYQETTFVREVDEKFPCESDLPGFGMACPSTGVSVVQKDGSGDEETEIRWFNADSGMLAVAQKVADKALLEQCAEACLTQKPRVKVGGNGVAGPTFVDNKAFREYAWTTFQADSLDMESSAVAHVAYVNKVPFIIFRSLSDLAGGGPGENEIGTFFALAADNSAKVLIEFVRSWSVLSNKTESQPVVTKEFTFGLLLVGPYNDRGWSQATYDAGKYAESMIPGAKMVYIDKVNTADRPGTTGVQLAEQLLAQGAKLVIFNSDDMKDDALQFAQKHAEVSVIHLSGDYSWKDGKDFKSVPNLVNVMGRMEYGKMMGGCAAALTTQTGQIGYLGPLINDETRRLAASVYLGARHCWTQVLKKNADDLKFKVIWIGFWFNIPGVTSDPTQVADDFFNSGYDVVVSGIDTTEALVEAKKFAAAGKKDFAVSYDLKAGCDEAPAVCLGVPYFNWGPAYIRWIQAAQGGTFASTWEWNGPDWTNINNPDTGAVGFVKGQALSVDNSAKMDDFIKALAGGLNLWTGPINLQDGTTYLKDGEVGTDFQVWYLPQLLQGMEGQSVSK